MNFLPLTRMLQLASPALPIGGYSYSNGLETAIEAGSIAGEAGVYRWIADVIEFSLGSYEIPLLRSMSEAWDQRDAAALTRLNEEYLATRESAELRAGTLQMGYSLYALIRALTDCPAFLGNVLSVIEAPGLPCVWSGLAAAWDLTSAESAVAYAWAWAENQVLVAMKALPLGQSAGQRVLIKLGNEIVSTVERCCVSAREGRSNFAPALAILCAQHETQYSRLFRS